MSIERAPIRTEAPAPIPLAGEPFSSPWWAIGGAIVALVIELLFAASYIGALHKPTAHDVPMGIVAPPGVAETLVQQIGAQSGGAIKPELFTSDAEMRIAIDNRTVYGGLEISQAGANLIVADAAGLPATQALILFGQGFAAAQNMPLNIEHVHPLDEGDSRGLAPIYLVIAWIFGGYFGATVLTTLRGTAYRDRSHAVARLGLLVAYSILSGLLGALIAGPIIGAFPDGHFWSVSAGGTLIVFAVGAITMALQLLLGVVGTLIAILAFVILGNPSSGGIVPGELLPAFWRETGPWLPNAPGYVLIRNILYFDGNAIGRSLIVLAVYAIVGVAILLIFADRRRPSILPQDPEAELAAAAAAAG